MTIFITQGRFTDSAIKGLVTNPEDRAVAVGALLEAAGARLLHYFVTFGDYDFLVIIEGNDLQDAMSALLAAAASGGVTDLKTTVGVTSAEAVQAMSKAGAIAEKFRPAGT